MMRTAVQPPAAPATLRVRIVGPEGDPLAPADVRRLFPGAALTEERYDRFSTWSRVIALHGLGHDAVVGVATYRRVDAELRVLDFGVDAGADCRAPDVVNAITDALELACLAGGARRLLILPPPDARAALSRRGYVFVNEGCAGGWAEKVLR